MSVYLFYVFAMSLLLPLSIFLNYYFFFLQNNATTWTLLSSRSFSSTSATHSASPFRLNPKDKTQNAPPKDDRTVNEEIPGEEYYEEEQNVYYSPHRPKREWPPDMSKLSPKHQLRLERKYRRRAALKYARPRWVKATKLVQWGVIVCKFFLPHPPMNG